MAHHQWLWLIRLWILVGVRLEFFPLIINVGRFRARGGCHDASKFQVARKPRAYVVTCSGLWLRLDVFIVDVTNNRIPGARTKIESILTSSALNIIWIDILGRLRETFEMVQDMIDPASRSIRTLSRGVAAMGKKAFVEARRCCIRVRR